MTMDRLIFSMIFIFSMIILPSWAKKDGNHLHVGFYKIQCPNVERIVADVVFKAYLKDLRVTPHLLRLFFHDCFVKGCDASLLLDSTPSGEPVEKTSPANGNSLKGLDLIDEIKTRIEEECPETVSCADILAFATRDATVLSGMPYYPVPAGRRDGRTSLASDVRGNLPSGGTPIDDIIDIFKKKDFSVEEMVVLLGAHSLGSAHCGVFDYRLYNFSSKQTRDPSLNPFYAAHLSATCPRFRQNGDVTTNFDPITPFSLDNMYYWNLLKGRGLLEADQALATNPKTSEFVHKMAFDPIGWKRKFTKAIIHLGRTDVLTGKNGEIRKSCRATK
ncbi:hypothetical protein FEM48_Zijuj10G0052300 [Ziziphus jujuba var. spinosa]|uniref:Peroxidase n=1 Tax=Ziziphus jujuba var. spinosa TaxID=714518 RepID=A0A978ULH8_ZIZJJ|nr:hypothetical protein FEM48_Zijuj10G0052300 [Ziziphus jujuba var. spinosa]